MKKCIPYLVAALLLSVSACKKNSEPTGAWEKVFADAGSHAAARMEVGDRQYRIHYPADLSGNHPVVAWGNGTGAQPKNYEGLFDHLASWGFVVIDSYSKNTGTGAEILASAEYLVAENNNPSGIFYNKIDINRIGAVGHSQGAAGVLNAHTDYAGGSIFKTVVPIALPSPNLTNPEHTYNTGDVTGSLLLLSGTNDGLISPKKSNRQAFDDAPDNLPAAMAMAVDAGHNAILDNGGKHRGYLTAWLLYRLSGNTDAREAFVSEIAGNDTWTEVRIQNLN